MILPCTAHCSLYKLLFADGNAMPNLRALLEYSVQAEVAQVDLRASAYLKPKPQEASISRAL